MNKHIQLFFTFFGSIFPLFLSAQVWNGNISLASQMDINNFPTNYPNIKTIVGKLLVGSNDTLILSDITDLSPLSQLKKVKTFYIGNNGQLANLDGLKIDTTDALAVFRNPNLTQLSGLNNLQYSYSLTIQRNPKLSNLEGLNGLLHAKQITINYNDNLVSLVGLDALNQCNYFGIFIENNPRLQSITGMPKLELAILKLTNNDSITHFGQLPALKSAGIGIYNNKNFIDFADIQNTQATYCGFEVVGNPNFESFKGFENLKTTTLWARNNPKFRYLNNLTQDSLLSLNVSGNALEVISFPKMYQSNRFEIHQEQHLKTLINATPTADSLYNYNVYGNDSLNTIHEDFGPRRIKDFALYQLFGTGSNYQFNNNLEEISGFKRLELVGDAPYYRFFIGAAPFRVVNGFNELNQGAVTIDLGNHQKSDFEGVFGFNGLINGSVNIGYGFDTSNVYPKKIIGFDSLKNVNQLFFYGVRDSLSAFKALNSSIFLGVYNYSIISVSTGKNCHIGSDVFSKLTKMDGGRLNNCSVSDRIELIKFPNLEHVDDYLTTFNNSGCLSFKNIYSKLTTTGICSFRNLKSLKSLDGIEGITSFKVLDAGTNTGDHIYIEGCDSLSDCSALCEIFKNATFYPPQFTNYINNPLFPCDNLANVKAYCDTLTSAVEPPPASKPAEIRVFPNPESTGLLNIQLENSVEGVFPVSVFDMQGRKMLAGNTRFQYGLATLRTDMLPFGQYQLTILTNEKPVSIKFLRAETD